MSIRLKTFISIFLVMTLTLLGLFWVARSVLVERFNRLEQEQSLENMKRVRASFEDIFAQMESKSADWAGWDDAYTFVQDGNQEFKDANLYESAAEQISMNLIAYYNRDKTLLPGGSFAWTDALASKGERAVLDIPSLFPADSYFFSFEREDEIRRGFLMTKAGPLYVVSRAVFDTEISKPAMGYLVFARFLDQAVVEDRMALTSFPLAAALVQERGTENPDFVPALAKMLAEKNRNLLIPIHENQQKGYLTFHDWQENPVYIVGMTLERPILAQGMATIRLLMIAFAVISILSGILVVLLLEKVVITRLYRLKNNVSAVTQSKPRQHQIPVEGQDEIRRVGDAINSMLDELDQQTRQIEAMLSNMFQGLCRVDHLGNLRGEASAYFWELFPSDNHEDFNIVRDIFHDSSLAADQKEMISSLLEVSVGESIFNFEINVENLPTSFSRELKGSLHHFECDWSVITGQDRDLVESVLVTFRDVTKLRELQAANEKERRSMVVLLQILKMGSQRYALYANAAHTYLQNCLQTVRAQTWNEAAHVTLNRDLHTIKGNSRVYGLTDIASHIHQVEELLGKREEACARSSEILSGLETLDKLLAELDQAARILGYRASAEEEKNPSIHVPASLIDETLHVIDQLTQRMIEETPTLKSLSLSYRRLRSTDMNIICQDLRTMGNSLSKDLGLCEPALKLQTETPLFLEHDAASKVRDVLVHMVRNSLYHGFMGMKLDHPEIEIQSQVGTRWILAYRDNGKGLNCRKLRELGQKRGIAGVDSWSPQQLVELIFEEGVSTAEKVNDISGRGTGMGAVRAMIEELGGRLLPEVAAENPQGYAPLVFRLDFPRSWLVDEETPSGNLLPASA